MSSGEEKVSSGFNIVSQHNEGKKDFKISSLKPITTSVVSKTPPNHSIEVCIQLSYCYLNFLHWHFFRCLECSFYLKKMLTSFF